MDLGLVGRVAVVTGASRGIGKAIAAELTREGCRVVACGNTHPAEGDLTITEDLRDPDAAARIVAATLHRFERIDIVVNNAGTNTPRRLEQTTDEQWRDELEINLLAAVRLTQASLASMRAQRWGRIISIASTSGRQPDPYFGPYSAAKAALINFTTNVSRSFAHEGVLANCVIPGVVTTDLVQANAAAAADRQGTTPEEVMAAMLAKDPVAAGRFGTPEEITAAVVFLASERASWITGSCVTIDGGTIRVAP